MNVTTNPDGSLPDLCPWNDRRLPREMYVKLFVVTFTVLGSFAHLMHLRRESRDLFTYVLLFFVPIAGSSLIVIPIIGLLVQVFVCAGDKSMIKSSLGILIGAVRNEDEQSNNENSQDFNWPPKYSSRMARALLVQAALLSQCITSVWLFTRRVRHASDALYDRHILQSAILGICTSAMSIVHLILEPQYPSRECIERLSVKTSWVLVLRPVALIRSRPDNQDGSGNLTKSRRLFLRWFHDYSYACNVYPILQGFGFRVSHDYTAFIGDWIKETTFAILRLNHYALVVLPLIGLYYRQAILQRPLRALQLLIFCILSTYTLTLLIYGVAIVLHLYAVMTPYMFFQQFRTLFGKPSNYKEIENSLDSPAAGLILQEMNWDYIWTYGHSPVSLPCPAAWKDPIADYVWWLA